MLNFITQNRRGTTEEWLESVVIPKQGEIVLEECTDGVVRMKIGNGKSLFKNLPYPDEKIVQQLAVLDERINNIVNFESVASNDIAAEVTDIRVGYDGQQHTTAGDAVRSLGIEVDDLRRSLSQFINAQAVDGLYYEDNKLYLKAGDQILEDSVVQIISGTGGGTGSSTSLKIMYVTPSPYVVTPKDEAKLKFVFEGSDSSGDVILQASATWKIDGKIISYGTVNAGENEFDITKYLKVGTSKVFLTVTDDSGNIATKTWSVQLIDVRLESKFDDTKKYPAGSDVIFDYIPYGAVDKTIHFILDNKELDSAMVLSNISGSTVKYSLPKQEHGAHLLEVYITAKVGIQDVESDHIFKDIIWFDEDSKIPVIGTINQSFKAKQYDTTNIVYTVYDSQTETPEVTISVDNKPVSVLTLTQATNVYAYNTTEVGEHIIKITCGTPPTQAIKPISANIEKLDFNISPVTLGLVFDFNPVGKSNTDINRLWKDNDVSMRVSDNFDWINGGYQIDENGDTYFCIKSGTTATIDHKMFADDATLNGKEAKIVFKTTNVANPDAIFLSCVDNTTATNHIGLEMGVHEARIYGQTGNLNLAYSEDDVIEFEFNITKSTESPSMVMGYEDGVATRPMVYDNNYSFKQNTPKEIVIGSNDCDVHIYRFKVYSTSLTDAEILNNFIADARTSAEILNRYTRNQIYDENQKLTPQQLAKVCPWLRVYKVSAPHFTNNKSNKVIETIIQQIYEGGDPVLDNWVAYNVQHSGQGTSSNNYGAAGRNLDFIMNKSGIDGVKPYFILGDGTRAEKITLTRTSVPTNYLNAKVNIASSNNLTNPILAKRYNQFNPYRRPFIRPEGTELSYIKDTMEFYNCVIFIEETDPDLSTHREFADTECHFYAIGNIGDSKKTDNSRATDPDDKYECCVEIMDVGLPLSDFPVDTMINAMGYTEDETTQEKIYTWAKDENLGILYEKNPDGSYVLTSDTTVDLNKTYYVDILEHDDFSEDYTYGWRYLGDEDDSEAVEYCKQKWIEFYRFVTTSTDEEFKANLKNYFVVDSALYYYLFTTRYCMVDNRAKNTFWHYGKTSDGSYKWDLCWDYDNDTSLGLNNYGKQVYRYGLEDFDVDAEGIEIFRESNSTFFCRVRDLFKAELKTMYTTLESKGAWHAQSFLNEADAWQSQFPEELWRLDIERKYIRTYNSSFISGKGDDQFLKNMANGKMKYHRREWERNQERYMASKFQTPVAGGDTAHANFRVTRPTGDLAIPVNYEFTLTPYAYMYLNVQYGGNSAIGVRAQPNVPTRVPYSGSEADIINVYSASSIRDFGDLSAMYAKTVSVGNATRIKKLVIGNDFEGYANPSLNTLGLTNPLLEELDIQNVTGFTEQKTLNLEALLNLKKIYANGAALEGFTFARGGKLELAELPPVTSLILKSLPYLSDENLKVASYDNISKLVIEDCPNISAIDLFNKCSNVTSLRLVNVDFGETTYEYFVENFFNLGGVDADDKLIDNAWITGKAKFDKLDGEQYDALHSKYPLLDILFNELTCTVEFKDTDLATTIYGPVTVKGVNSTLPSIVDPVSAELVTKPRKTETVSHSFTWSGWSTEQDYITVDPSPINKIRGNFVFYPTFDAHIRQYTITYLNNDGSFLKSYEVDYGTSRDEYLKNAPIAKNALASNPDAYNFKEWMPSPEYVEGPVNCYATYELKPEAIHTVQLSDITYAIDTSTNELTILGYNNIEKKIIRIPETYSIEGSEYTVTTILGHDTDTSDANIITGFKDTDIEYVKLPSTLRYIGPDSFANNSKLTSVTIPENVSMIGYGCFANCTGLSEVYYNAINAVCIKGETEHNYYPFYGTASPSGYTVYIGENVETVPQNMFNIGVINSGYTAVRKLVFAENSKCELIDSYAFNLTGINELSLPNSIKRIGMSAFAYCQLTSVILPVGLEQINSLAFENNYELSYVYIPASVTQINAAAFRQCYDVEFDIAEYSQFVWTNGCLIDTTRKWLVQGNSSAVIPTDMEIETVCDYAFYGVKGITELIIPEGVKILGSYALYECSDLSSLKLPDTLTSIGSVCISRTNITELVLPSINLQTIDSFALSTNNNITELIIPASVAVLGYNVFSDCSNLKTVTLESTTLNLNKPGNTTYNLFMGCNTLETINVGWNYNDNNHLAINLCAPWGAPCSTEDPIVVKFADETIKYTSSNPEYLLEKPQDIIAAATKLADGEFLRYMVTLSGTVISIDTPWTEESNNITVTMLTEGTNIICLNLYGNNVQNVMEGNIIKVSGKLMKHNNMLTFDSGCKLLSVTTSEIEDSTTDNSELEQTET